MRFLSVCSGIESASVAWCPLGFTPLAFSEVDPFPCDVLAERHSDVPNWGDMTLWEGWPDGAVDVLVGGTPCQSFSISGKRGGLDDARGQLALCYGRIAARYRPRWVVWENVPGVLDSNGGRDFNAFVQSLVECGYQCAWRVLDAQYCGLAQQRKRVFLVGHLGDWRCAAAALFEPAVSVGDTPPIRRQEITRSINQYPGEPIVLMDQGGRIMNVRTNGTVGTLRRETHGNYPIVAFPWDRTLRRVTPRECERLQGFPDDYTLVMHKGKPAPDSLRHKALGNTMAVPCMAWIGNQLLKVEKCLTKIRYETIRHT
jgi:DNA (cytosine-5)-methyltransferase 1